MEANSRPRALHYTYFFGALLLLVQWFKYRGLFGLLFQESWDFIYGKGRYYSNDLYLNHSEALKGSILFKIARYVDFNNDFVAFALSCALHAIALLSVYLVARRYLNVDHLRALTVTFFLAVVAEGKFASSVMTSVIQINPFTPTLFAGALTYPLLLATLDRRYLAIATVAAVMASITVRASWLPLLVSFLFLLWDASDGPSRRKALRIGRVVVVFLPALIIALSIAATVSAQLPADHAARAELVRRELDTGLAEESLFDEGWTYMVLYFAISFPLFEILVRRLESASLRRYCRVAMVTTFVLTLLGGIWAAGGYNYVLTDPRIVVLGIPRAANLYLFLLNLLIFDFLISRWTDAPYAKALAVGAYSVVTVYSTPLSLMIIAALGFVLLARRAVWARAVTDLPQVATLAAFVRGLSLSQCLAVAAVLATAKLGIGMMAHSEWALLNLHTLAFTDYWRFPKYRPTETDALAKVRICPEDFEFAMLGFGNPRYGPQGLYIDDFANMLARKSHFVGYNAHFWLNLPLLKEDEKRWAAANGLVSSLVSADAPPADVIAELNRERVVVLLPTHYAVDLRGQQAVRSVGEDESIATFGRDMPKCFG